MGNSVLTPLQSEVLDSLFAAGLGERGYCISGGTALTEYYLKHRLSDDLDLFTRNAEIAPDDLDLTKNVFEKLSLQTIRDIEGTGFARYTVIRGGTEKLKIELCLDYGARMGPAEKKGGVLVDSLEDIAVRKVCAMATRQPPERKDFVDLYFILKETSFTLDYLLIRAKEKHKNFEDEEGMLLFASILLEVKKLEMLPKKYMIKPLTLEQLREFLVPQAEEIIRRLRPHGP